MLQLADGTQLNGAQFDDAGDGVAGALVSEGDERFYGESGGLIAWRNFAVPWVPGDVHERIKTMSDAELAWRAQVKNLYVIHHDPDDNDDVIDAKLARSRELLATWGAATNVVAPGERTAFEI